MGYSGRIQLSQQNSPRGGNNPFANTTGLKTAFFRDFDGDGDLDIVNQNYFDDFTYFENTGSATNPNYQQQTSHYYAVLDNLDIGDFVDIDGDGDYDFLNGNTFRLFQSNTYIPQTNNPINSPDSRLTFVDFDEDGDYDCFVGTNYQILYYKNDGTPTSPSFALSTDNPFANVVSNVLKPKLVFGDVDIDGDIDMFMSDEYQPTTFSVPNYKYLRYFENQTIYRNTLTLPTSTIQNLVIAPNPNNGQFSIEVPKSLQQGEFNLQIFDLTGRILVNRLYQNTNNQLLINDLEQYANGFYIITLQSEIERYQAKVLKQ